MLHSLHPRCAIAMAASLLIPFALSGAAPAQAHCHPETTVPADGAVVDAAPIGIAISFFKPMHLTLFEVTNDSHFAYLRRWTDNVAPLINRYTTTINATPPLPAGSYTVHWRGLCADGHPTSGRFSFEFRP